MPCHDFREPRHGFAKSTSCILLKWSLLYFDTYWGDPYYKFRHNIVNVAVDTRGCKGEWICRLLWLMKFIVNNRTDRHWKFKVALSPLCKKIFKLCQKLRLIMVINFKKYCIKNSSCRYWIISPLELRVFLVGHTVAMVTYRVHQCALQTHRFS